jgi:hypothetical protein
VFLPGFLRNLVRKRGILRGECGQDRGESVVGDDSKFGSENYATFLRFIFGPTTRRIRLPLPAF